MRKAIFSLAIGTFVLSSFFEFKDIRLSRKQIIETHDLNMSDAINPNLLKYDHKNDVYIFRYCPLDNWEWRIVEKIGKSWYELKSEQNGEYPAKKKVLKFKNVEYLKPKDYVFFAVIRVLPGKDKKKKRLVLIAAEDADQKLGSKIYPHLGLLYVGTIAEQEGFEVVLYDELITGRGDIKDMIEPGDYVGLSVLVTNVQRSVQLAKDAKALGAQFVFAGNDTAIYRAKQILSLPDKPIDAICQENDLSIVRDLLKNLSTDGKIEKLIQGVAQKPEEAQGEERFNGLDNPTKAKELFMVPNLFLFSKNYWEEVWNNYRTIYAKKYIHPERMKNASILMANGCSGAKESICAHCGIYGVSDIQVCPRALLAKQLQVYQDFGINTFISATDSAYEMAGLLKNLEQIKPDIASLTIYARAQGVAKRPKLLDRWMKVASERLMLNIGFESADDMVLQNGCKKPFSGKVSMAALNREALKRTVEAGAHLHFSMIFGSPGETIEACKKNLEFIEWALETGGTQIDQIESDYFWLNFGSPASRIFYNYDYARKLAALAHKSISKKEWHEHFYRHKDDLMISWNVQKAWYRFFTKINLDTASQYIERSEKLIAGHKDIIPNRAFVHPEIV